MAAESGEKVEPSDVLKYSTCVKKCPSADVAEAVECSKTRAMLEGVSSKYYHECVYYLAGYDLAADIDGAGDVGVSIKGQLPLRYKTVAVGDRFCLPDPD